MKETSSINSSFVTPIKDLKEYDFEIQSILSHQEEISLVKKKKGSAYAMELSVSEKGETRVRGKVKMKRMDTIATNKKERYNEEMTEIQYIKNISLLKERTKTGEIEFSYRIDGEIMKINKSNNDNDNELFARLDYEQMDIQIEDFNSQTNPISGKDDLQDVIPILMNFADFLKSFIELSNVIYNQFRKVLQPVNLETYLVFILENVRHINIQSITKDSLREMILSIKYQELEENIPQYIDYILDKFYSPIPNKSPSNIPVYRVLETIIPDILSVTNDIKRLGKFGDFSILTEMHEIVTKIDNELFLVFDAKESSNDDEEENKTNLINRLFYLLLIHINKYYKKTYPICCNYEKDSLINYAKGPFILCFDCKAIVCHGCFKLHRLHNYFDFACTIKKKFANIHSSLSRFLNYKKGDSSGASFGKINTINIEFAEDHILFCILKGLSCVADDYLMYYLKNLSHQKSGYITILHFIDIFLLEYLYKTIFPFKHNPHFLDYTLRLKCSEDRNYLLAILLAAQSDYNNKIDSENNQILINDKDSNELYSLYTQIRETKLREQKYKKIQSIVHKMKPKLFDLDNLFCETKLRSNYHNSKPYFFDQKLTNNNYVDSSLEDFEQVKSNYSKLRYQIQKLKAKEKSELLKDIPSTSHNFRRSSIKMTAPEKTDPDFVLKEKKVQLSNWISTKLNWIFNRETFAFELKWYYAYNDEEEKCTKVKFIDGMGPLYEYVMCYFDEILKSTAEFGTICFNTKLNRNNNPESMSED